MALKFTWLIVHFFMVITMDKKRSTLNAKTYQDILPKNCRDLNNMISLEDVEQCAILNLKKGWKHAFGYFEGGSDNEYTLQRNKDAFKSLMIRPHVMGSVDDPDTEISFKLTKRSGPEKKGSDPELTLSNPELGRTDQEFHFPFPIGIAPSGLQGMANRGGEICTAKAACALKTLLIVSTMATNTLEDIAAEIKGKGNCKAEIWFQLYVFKDREVTRRLIERAEKANYSALVLTVDTPVIGRRRADVRSQFSLPKDLTFKNFEDPGTTKVLSDANNSLAKQSLLLFESKLRWEDLSLIEKFTKLPVIVKGIMRGDDAKMAINKGASGIIVSNHGGRQLDGTPSTIEVLPEVVKAVKSVCPRCPVFIDGGIRSGTDVYKSIALGAKMVFLGRPIIHGLAVTPKDNDKLEKNGVKWVMNLVEEEFKRTMQLSGTKTIGEIYTEGNNGLIVQEEYYKWQIMRKNGYGNGKDGKEMHESDRNSSTSTIQMSTDFHRHADVGGIQSAAEKHKKVREAIESTLKATASVASGN